MLCKRNLFVVLFIVTFAVTAFAESLMPGDFNEDNIINMGDLQVLANEWLTINTTTNIDGSDVTDFGDFAIMANNWGKNVSELVINEFMAENNTNNADPQGEFDDWLEIHNTTDSPIDLAGMYITDDLSDLTKCQIPAGYPAETTVPAKGYIVIWADKDPDDGPLHVGFNLNADEEEIALVAADGVTIINSLTYKDQLPDISYGSYPDGSAQRRYFGFPTPGAANNEGYLGVAPTPAFSKTSGIYFDTFDLTLSIEPNDAVIHYTTDHSIPTLSSPVYTGPITISETTEIIARSFKPGFADSVVEAKNYVKVGADIRNFNSNLPIVIVDSFDYYIDGEYSSTIEFPYRNVYAIIVDVNDTGRATLTDDPDCQTRGGMRVRGQTTASYSKKQYKFEAWDNMSDDKDVSILGMPSDSDWVIHSPVTDGSYMRNYMTYKLFREMGNYGVRTRFCELFCNQTDGEVTYADYRGIYIFMEKIKICDGRLESEKLEPSDDAEPEITGGYVIKQDKGSNLKFTTSTYFKTFQYDYPSEFALTLAQRNWIKWYCNELELALASTNFDDPNEGYMAYLDRDTFIDYHIMVEISKNVDGYGLSDYYFKPRNEVLRKEPVWDYNWAWGNASYNDCQYPERWHYALESVWNGSGYRWYRRLFEDINFELRYLDRWYELRKDLLTTDNLTNRIDSYAAKLDEAQPRDYAKWGTGGSYETPLNKFKTWITERMAWIDDQFRKPPTFSQDDSVVDTNFQLAISLSEPPVLHRFVDYNDSWRYLDDYSIRSSEWAVLEYNDDSWPIGTGPFGFGDGDENTVIDYGPDPDNKYITTYFRKSFNVEKPEQVHTLTINLLRDDGAAIWLNSNEFYDLRPQNNMAYGLMAYKTPATAEVEGADENRYYSYEIDPGLLHEGENVIGIEVHLSSITSEDMSFDCEVEGIVGYHDTAGTLYYTTDGSDPRLHGGAISPTAIEYTSPISFTKTTQIIARELDNGDWTARNEAIYQIGSSMDNLRITELMYHPADYNHPDDPNTEYIELQNIGSSSINLNLVHFTDGVDFTFGDINLAAGDYILVVRDIAAFEAKYGSGYPIAGEYEGSLSNGGEEIVLRDALGDEIHDFDYKDGWYDITDGRGFSLVINDPYNPDANSWDEKDGWRASASVEGSPGEEDISTVPLDGSIVINEVMTNPVTGQTDWIELYNTTDTAINIGGWFISDDTGSDVNSTKYEIAPGVAVPAYGYYTFYEGTQFGNIADPGCNEPFGLGRKGDQVYLQSGDNGVLTSYFESEDFGAAATGVTFGRYEKSTGTFNFVAMADPTPNAENSYPVVGPIVINEIMYHAPQGDSADYIELYNTSSSAVTLQSYDADLHMNVGWTFSDGVDYTFPLGTVIPGHGYLIIADDPAVFTATYGFLPIGVTLYGPFENDTKLSNGGEKVQLSIPVGDGNDYIEIDRVTYDDKAPWPESPDGDGDSLSRISTEAYGNDPINWTGKMRTPGGNN